jgi:site-specific DNA-methyltransferase (adenine-specific)
LYYQNITHTKIIANELGWSTGKTAMADIVFKKATPELEEKVLSNEITINQAYQEIKKEEKKVGYLIEMFTKEGDTIFEPFAGSGTTIIAARDKNRNILSAEIDEKTYNIAKALL